MAKKFRFRLEVVEGLRRRERDGMRRAVALALAAVGRAERDMAQSVQALKDSLEQSRAAQVGGAIDLQAVRGHQYYRGVLHRRILEMDTSLAERQESLARARGALARAASRVKVIEKLRERAQARYRKDLLREEQTIQNEMAANAYLRRRSRHKDAMKA